MRLNRLTWCGVLVAVSWVLLIGQILLVYLSSGGTPNPCYGPPPLPYPNRLTAQEFTFLTTDSTAQILEFYQRTGPLPPPNYAPTLNEQVGNRFSYEFPSLKHFAKVKPDESCGEQLYVSIHEYGFFRIGMLVYYWRQPFVPPVMR